MLKENENLRFQSDCVTMWMWGKNILFKRASFKPDEDDKVSVFQSNPKQLKSEAENQTMIKSCENVEYLIVLLRRVVHSATGPMVIENSINSVTNICVR